MVVYVTLFACAALMVLLVRRYDLYEREPWYMVLVAVALGVALLGEQPGAGAVAGLLLILAGSWLSTDGRLPPPLVALATRVRARRAERRVERRSHPMNAPSAWTSCWTTAAGSKSSTASACSRR